MKLTALTAGSNVPTRSSSATSSGSSGVDVNGVRLREGYANGPTARGEAGTDLHVPAEHVVVLGDNRAQSCDSRVWGPLAVRRIVGVAFAIQRGSRRIPLP